jgi:hypothetical protein
MGTSEDGMKTSEFLSGESYNSSIEDIILDGDYRGMGNLRPYVSRHFCSEAARLMMDATGPVMIATGFYIMGAQKPESDGPPGALAIGKALLALNRQVSYVTDQVSLAMMEGIVGDDAEVINFPISSDQESREYADKLLNRINPGLLVAIERCSLTKDGTYRNIRGLDISANTARIDYLFMRDHDSIGIGDGGNEIGMGNLAKQVAATDGLPNSPAVTKVSKLVISSVSNWGGYGLVTALSRMVGRNLLPSIEEDKAVVRQTIDLGAVDGISTKSVYAVDGFDLEANAQLLSRLHQLLDLEGIPSP